MLCEGRGNASRGIDAGKAIWSAPLSFQGLLRGPEARPSSRCPAEAWGCRCPALMVPAADGADEVGEASSRGEGPVLLPTAFP